MNTKTIPYEIVSVAGLKYAVREGLRVPYVQTRADVEAWVLRHGKDSAPAI